MNGQSALRSLSAWATVLTTMVTFGTRDVAADESTTANAERPLMYGEGASLAVLATRTTNPAMVDPPAEATGTGLTLRLQGVWGLLSGPGFSVGPFGAFETGLGYQDLDGQLTGHAWFLLRLELGGQASMHVSSDVDVSFRAGIYGHYNAAREVGADDDVLFGKVLARYQRFAVAAGAGQSSHLFFGAQYQFTRDFYAGVEYSSFPGSEGMFDYGSHEVRVLIGYW